MNSDSTHYKSYEGTRTENSKKVSEIRSEYAQKVREEGNENLASKIATMQEQDLSNFDKMETLKDVFPECEDLIMNLYEDIEEFKENRSPEFDITDYDERQPGVKTEIAQDYANHLVRHENIHPVVIDNTTLFYQFDSERKIWKEIDIEMIKKKASEKLAHFWTRHVSQQFKQTLKDHPEYIHWNKMGLEENQILMKNGEILNLKTLETRPAKKQDYAINALNAIYSEEPEAELLPEFLKQTFPKEEERQSLQEWLGFALNYPNDDYEIALLLLGVTDSGKSTFLNVLEYLFEHAETTNLSFPQLGHQRAFHVEKLKESVLNFDHDMEDKKISTKSRIKNLISKEEITADPKHRDSFQIDPQANYIVASNSAPDDSNATEAFYNRFLTVEAPERVPKKEQDKELLRKLSREEELNWLFKWAIEGLHRLWEQNTFTVNRTEYETKKIWTKYGDNIDQFIYDQITRDREEGKNVPTTDVYEVYEKWCETELEDPVSRKKFIARASNHPDMEKKKTMAYDGSGRRQCFKFIQVEDFPI